MDAKEISNQVSSYESFAFEIILIVTLLTGFSSPVKAVYDGDEYSSWPGVISAPASYHIVQFHANPQGYEPYGYGTICPAVMLRNNWGLTANHCINAAHTDNPESGLHLPSTLNGRRVEEIIHFWSGPPDTHRPTNDDSHLWEFFGDAALVKSEISVLPIQTYTLPSTNPPSCLNPQFYEGLPAELVGKSLRCHGRSGNRGTTWAMFPVLSLWDGWKGEDNAEHGLIIGPGTNQAGELAEIGSGDSGGPCYLVEGNDHQLVGIISESMGIPGHGGILGQTGIVGIWTMRSWLDDNLPAPEEQLPKVSEIIDIQQPSFLHQLFADPGDLSQVANMSEELFFRVEYTTEEKFSYASSSGPAYRATYAIMYSTVSDMSGTANRGWYPADNQTAAQIILLENGRTYFVRVASRNGCGVTLGPEVQFKVQGGQGIVVITVVFVLILVLLVISYFYTARKSNT